MEIKKNASSELLDDFDIAQKFIVTVPYDSDDSDFEWHSKYDSDADSSATSSSDKLNNQKKKRVTSNSTVGSYREKGGEEDLRDVLRAHRSLIVSNSSGISESVTPVKNVSSLNKSFPLYKKHSDTYNNKLPFRQSLSSYGNFSNFASNFGVTPTYKNYQLLGDSQLLRFTEQILMLKSLVVRIEDSKVRYRGYCVSGQKIKDLENRLLKGEHKLSNKVIMLIGTNDFLRNTDYESMCATYSSIMRNLKSRTESIVLVTVPPIPKFNGRTTYWNKFRRFNDYITKLKEDPRVSVVDLATALIGYDNTPLKDYFEQYYENNMDRIDLIHLNKKGFALLKALLDIHIFCS